jgi:WD40 repeat protein/uncharacterized caspase-like protein
VKQVLRTASLLVLVLAAECLDGPKVAAQTSAKASARLQASVARLVVQLGHSDFITSVAVSANGRLVVTGSEDRTACIWDAATGKEIRSLKGHTKEISDVAFSPDGRYVLTGSYDLTVRLWETETGREVRRFEGYSNRIRSVALTPNMRYVLTATDDSAVRILEVATAQPLDRYPTDLEGDRPVAFSMDGRFVLTGGRETKLRDAESGALIRSYGRVLPLKGSLVFSPDGRFILVGGPTPTSLQLWSTESGQVVRSYNLILESGNLVETSTVHSLAFSPDGRFIAAGGDFYDVWIKETETGRDVLRFGTKPFRGPVSDLAFSSDGRYVLAVGGSREKSTLDYHTGGNNGGSGFLFDANTGNEVLRFEGRADHVSSAVYSRDGRYVLVGNAHGKAILWDQETGKKIRQFEGHTDYVGSVAFSPDGRYVLTGSDDGTARTWDVATGRELQQFADEAHAPITSVAYSPDGRYIVAGGINNARLWEADTGRGLTWYAAVGAAVHAVAFGHYVLTGDNSGVSQLWEPETGRELRRFGEGSYSGNVFALAFSPDERYILTVGQNRIARLWETETGREVRRFDPYPDPKSAPLNSRIYAVAFSSDGRYVLTGGEDSIVRLWSVETGRELRRFEGHTGEIQSVAFSPDGKQVLTVAADNTVLLWNAASGQELCRLISLRDGDWVVVDPAGRFDAGNLEGIEGLNWIMPDDPLKPLPMEILMRDYYEPQLLPRLLKCNKENNCDKEFKPVRDFSKLNRVQPPVKISNVSLPDAEGYVNVTVEAGRGEGKYLVDGRESIGTTGVYDLRLFRDGQMVGSWPSDGAEKFLQRTSEDRKSNEKLSGETRVLKELRDWQRATEVKPDDTVRIDQKNGIMTLPRFRVKLPRGKDALQIEFSAYAFNEDRVKSQTAKWEWPSDVIAKLPKTQPIKPRAYVIAVGVNAYENADFDLEFAADDARRMSQVISEQLKAGGQYDQVVPVTLVSDYETKNCQKVPTAKQATKDNFRTVLELLSGNNTNRKLLDGVNNADQLQKATPDDLVLIMYSSHGYADRSGNFYFIPYDTGSGKGKVFTEIVRQHSISSEELSLWLRDVDAGEMVMIVDACHSAAAIAGQDFKPGPMGSRGLGQLSYDKGMRILTATQSDNVAWEYPTLKQGVLTYALLQDGIEARQADHNKDNTITLAEWLAYGVDRVPKLYQEVLTNSVQTFGVKPAAQPRLTLTDKECGRVAGRKELEEVLIEQDNKSRATQQPSLFDFTRKKPEVVLSRYPPLSP